MNSRPDNSAVTAELVFLWSLGIDAQDQERFVARALLGKESAQQDVLQLLRAERESRRGDEREPRFKSLPSATGDSSTTAVFGAPLPAAPSPAPLLLADELVEVSHLAVGRYRILGPLGRGGMGVVYHAECLKSGREVALKLLASGATSRQLEDRFRREAEILKRLDHPGIPRLHEAGEFDRPLAAVPGGRASASETAARAGDTPRKFIATEFVDGQGCRHFPWARAPVPEVLGFFAKVAEAIHFAHGKGVIHRDLKPENVLVDQRGNPQVIDFGVALLRSREGTVLPGLTLWGGVPGTPDYMSPEQMGSGESALDARSDVFSLGVMLVEALVGSRPLNSKVNDSKAAVSLDSPRISKALRRVIEKCLADSPDERYRDAKRLAEDLQQLAKGNRPSHVDLPGVREIRRLAKPRPAVALSLVLFGAVLLLVAWDRAVNAPRRAEARERSERAIGDIARAEELIHGEGRRKTVEGMKEAIAALERAAQVAPVIQPDVYLGRLPVLVHWRMGEAYYFLHEVTGNPEYLESASAAWTTAESVHYRLGDLPKIAFEQRVNIGGVRAHHPASGVAGAHQELAFFRDPRNHFRRARWAHERAIREFCYESQCNEDMFHVPVEKQGRDYACSMNDFGSSLVGHGAVEANLEIIRSGIRYLEVVVEQQLFGIDDIPARAMGFQNLADALVAFSELKDSTEALTQAGAYYDSSLAYRPVTSNPRYHCVSRRAIVDVDRKLGRRSWDELILELETIRTLCAEHADSNGMALCERQLAEYRARHVLREPRGEVAPPRLTRKAAHADLRRGEQSLAFADQVFRKEVAPVQCAWNLLARAKLERAYASLESGEALERRRNTAQKYLRQADEMLPAIEDLRFQRFLGAERMELERTQAGEGATIGNVAKASRL